MYRPEANFNVPMKLLIPSWKVVNGVRKKVYPDPKDVSDDLIFFGNFRTFGGTESNVNGVISIVNTAIIDTWYRPEIRSDCMVVLLNTNAVYEIIGDPENIEMRNQFLKFKVKMTAGKP
ncbi:hypothetical protein [Massilicoli timonensis]|uniref:hypothetical protein n=1 Tax=Massilicoli timonensis TaxID=2015901 RepID=UPI003AAE2001